MLDRHDIQDTNNSAEYIVETSLSKKKSQNFSIASDCGTNV
jgi:hypothetical protein